MSVNKLKTEIQRLANDFAEDLLRALSSASFAELSAELQGSGPARVAAKAAGPARTADGGRARTPRGASNGAGGKGRGRRTAADMGKTIDAIVSTLKTAGAGGLRSEDL